MNQKVEDVIAFSGLISAARDGESSLVLKLKDILAENLSRTFYGPVGQAQIDLVVSRLTFLIQSFCLAN